MCKALYLRLIDIQKAHSDAGHKMPEGVDALEAAKNWYTDGINREFDQMMLEFSGETVGRIPLCNLFDIPDGIDQKCLAEVVKNDGCAFPIGFQPDLGAYVDVNGCV